MSKDQAGGLQPVDRSKAVDTTDSPSPPEMLSRALEMGADPETLKGFMELQERWEARQAKKAFDRALSACKAELPPIIKRGEVDYTTSKGRTYYKHERLTEDIMQKVEPVLAKNGLSVRWETGRDSGDVVVKCIIAHEMGHSDATPLQAPPDTSGGKNPVQAVGSTVTYLQRYTLKAALGLAATDDTDGMPPEGSDGGSDAGQAPQETQMATDNSLTAFTNVGEMVYGEEWPEKREDLLQFSSVDAPEKLTEPQIKRLIKGMRAKAQNQGKPVVSDDEIPA